MTNVTKYLSLVNSYSQVHLKLEGEKLLLILPEGDKSIIDWWSVVDELKCRLNGSDSSWKSGTRVELIANYALEEKQLQGIAQALEEFKLKLKLVCTSNRQTAIAAAGSGFSVQQEPHLETVVDSSQTQSQELAEPLYLKTTIRSGMEVRHPSTIVIWGDLNPGAKAIAAGDIFVWGRLRGIAHAGSGGDRSRHIVALKMEPTQLRIADTLARAPSANPERFEPEVAYIATEGIRLAKAMDFFKTHSFSETLGAWR